MEVSNMDRNDYKLFIGMDPALQGDYFGVAIHALPLIKPKNKPWLPFLLRLIKLQAKNYSDIWNALNSGVLETYNYFYKLQIDYTNEKTIADFLEEKYGESRIIKTPFTKGEAGSKMRLAQNSLKLLQSGYNFPDHTKIPDVVESDNVKALKTQIINEEVVFNPDGSVKFRHKGKHNDLLHAWMLSLDEVMKFMLGSQGTDGIIIGGPLKRSMFRHQNLESMMFSKMAGNNL